MKKAILLHKRAKVPFDLDLAVSGLSNEALYSGDHFCFDKRCKMAFFQSAWRKVKVLSRPGSLLIPIKLD